MFGISKQRLHYLSRDRDLLLKAGVGIVLGSIALAFVIYLVADKVYDPGKRLIRQAASDPEVMLEAIRNPHVWYRPAPEVSSGWGFDEDEEEEIAAPTDYFTELTNALANSRLTETQKSLFADYLVFYHRKSTSEGWDEAVSNLRESTEQGDISYAAECYGDVKAYMGDWESAVKFYRQELALRESKYCRNQIIELTVAQEGTEALAEFLDDPDFARYVGLGLRIEYQVQERDLAGLFHSTLLASIPRSPVFTAVTLFLACIWFIVVGQMAGFRKDQLLIYGAAIGLGVLSTVLTVYVIYLQEHVYGWLEESTDLMGGLIYMVAGVGLREELIKLLFFIPLVPWLRRRGNDMEVLVVASFVGLGFALEENINYFLRSGGQDVVGRFLTANFFHMCLTGLIGYAFYRMVRYPKRQWEGFLTTFLLMVAAHGTYNAVQILPDLAEYSGLGALIIMALLAYRFFGVSDTLKWTGSQQISPLGVFVIGVAVMIGVTLNIFCFGLPPFPYYVKFLLSTIQLIPVMFIFINRYRDA